MQLYSFSPITGEYTGPAVKQNKPGILSGPAHTTQIAPPRVALGHVPAFRNGAWVVLEDHRGKTMYDGHKAVIIRELGPIPAGLTEDRPEPEPQPAPEPSPAMKALHSLGFESLEEAVVHLAAAQGGKS